MNASDLLSILKIPAWTTDRSGTVQKSNACGPAIGKKTFPDTFLKAPSGLILRNEGKDNEIRFYFRKHAQGYLCIAYSYLLRMPFPFGARMERVTGLLDEVTDQLLRLAAPTTSEHPEDVPELRWMAMWAAQPLPFSSIPSLLSKTPEIFSAAWEVRLFWHLFGLFGNEDAISCDLPQEMQVQQKETIGRFIEISAILLLFRRLSQINRLELQFVYHQKQLLCRMRIRINSGSSQEIGRALANLRSVPIPGGSELQMNFRTNNDGVYLIELSLPPYVMSNTLYWKWRDIEDTTGRKLLDALLLIADGCFSVDYRAACPDASPATSTEAITPSDT